MDMLEYNARVLNMVLDSLRPRKPVAPVDGPKSDCCSAPLERVMKDLLACSVCGSLCSDGSVSCP